MDDIEIGKRINELERMKNGLEQIDLMYADLLEMIKNQPIVPYRFEWEKMLFYVAAAIMAFVS